MTACRTVAADHLVIRYESRLSSANSVPMHCKDSTLTDSPLQRGNQEDLYRQTIAMLERYRSGAALRRGYWQTSARHDVRSPCAGRMEPKRTDRRNGTKKKAFFVYRTSTNACDRNDAKVFPVQRYVTSDPH